MINIKNIQFTSVIITSLNDGFFIENLLNDLLNQTIKRNSYEVLILEAGHFKSENQYNKIFSNNKIKFSFYKKEKLSRTASLNFLIDKAVGDFVVRLDARSRIKKDYLNQLIRLSNSTSAACVGGVKLPVGTNAVEKIIALTMINPIAFGGGNFRKENFRGYANGIYLGAFKKELVYLDKWYDEINPKISEDTDITRRIIETGEKVFIDSSIVVEYQPRDSYNNFFKMCFNYGVGRGIFIYKHKKVNDFRQIIPPICVCLGFLLIALSFYKIIFLFFLISLVTLYLILILIFSFVYSKHFYDMFKLSYATAGCHLFWILGFFYGPLIAKRYN
jgi:succinoglycan biosynthesis protein ExoA